MSIPRWTPSETLSPRLQEAAQDAASGRGLGPAIRRRASRGHDQSAVARRAQSRGAVGLSTAVG